MREANAERRSAIRQGEEQGKKCARERMEGEGEVIWNGRENGLAGRIPGRAAAVLNAEL